MYAARVAMRSLFDPLPCTAVPLSYFSYPRGNVQMFAALKSINSIVQV